MNAERTIHIRDIQHYLYCPRRFALLTLNCDWSENAAVVRANLMHHHVHDGSHSFSDRRKVVRSDLPVFHDAPEYDLYGVTDCVEFLRDDSGVPIPEQNGRFRVQVIEYKPRAPKDMPFHETDAIQVFAQKICADYVWHCDCDAYLYYADIRKRVKLPFDTEFLRYDDLLKRLLDEMRTIVDRHEIPKRKKGQRCSGCSLAERCFPKAQRSTVREQIMAMTEDMVE
ncbi:MAG: Dna2/Cas4 domain-containing protein [Oscillospiraceae bacterium]|nr:Dna2/Cas4 domain-containing protein [Oscillospiraceae bacterium]